MKGGVLQQFGTPDDIYNRPANTSWPTSSARRR
jgi:ABC-type sugar transport system ATPase subunit